MRSDRTRNLVKYVFPAIWFTYGISECLVLLAAFALTKYSERNGIVYQ